MILLLLVDISPLRTSIGDVTTESGPLKIDYSMRNNKKGHISSELPF